MKIWKHGIIGIIAIIALVFAFIACGDDDPKCTCPAGTTHEPNETCCNTTDCTCPIAEPEIKMDDGGILQVGQMVEEKGILVWSDEFNGNSLDTDKWNYDYGGGGQYGNWGGGNGARQWYRPGNVRVQDGFLVIEAGTDNYDRNFPYSSGRITTGGTRGAGTDGAAYNQHFPRKNWYGITTGYVEARIKTPKGQGFWPAFWMLGADVDGNSGHTSVGWPSCGEIDILETIGGQETTMHQTIHYGTIYSSQYWYNTHTYTLDPGAGDAYHVYAVKWSGSGENGTLIFYCDGIEKKTINIPGDLRGGAAAKPGAFFNNVPWVIIFNLAIGGDMGGNLLPSNDSMTNSNWENRSLIVDWVRVYE